MEKREADLQQLPPEAEAERPRYPGTSLVSYSSSYDLEHIQVFKIPSKWNDRVPDSETWTLVKLNRLEW